MASVDNVKVANTSRNNSSPPANSEPRTTEIVSFLVGVIILMLGLGLLGQEINAVLWRFKAKLYYMEGVARVEKTEIIPREGVFELEVTYHLERSGRNGRSTTWIDRDDPWLPSRDLAEKRQARFQVGRLYPCWYRPDNPVDFNELAPDGLQLDGAVKRLGIPLIVLAAGWAFCRWPWRRWKARGSGRGEKAASSPPHPG